MHCRALKTQKQVTFQKGTKLRKVATNDRSAPIIGGKPSSSSPGVKPSSTSSSSSLITNQLEREPKPGSGGRTYGGGSGSPMGGLFANGLPSKPSENKIRRANTSVTPATTSPPQPPPLPGRPFLAGVAGSAPPPLAAKPSDLLISSKPSPPPPPIQTVKPVISASSGGRDQFKTMRPMKPETSWNNSGLRRSGSSEDISSRESTPVRAPLARPTVAPPGRPSAPPPPPPIVRTNGSHPDPPPPPSVPPIATTMPNRFGSAPVMGVRSEENAPPPPPRSASKAGGTPPIVATKFSNRDAHPLDR
ncbi:hypothetical protein COOONC_05215 [Cooperia oncophora]